MVKKLCILIAAAIFLSACGASTTETSVGNATQLLYGTSEAALDCAPLESAPGSEEPAAAEYVQSPACDAEYFIFTDSTNEMDNEDGLTLLYENQCIPRFSSTDSDRSLWVEDILEDIADRYESDSRNLYAYAEDFTSIHGTEAFYSYSNYLELGVARHDDTVVSLLCLSSIYSGGSHPNAVQTAWNLDMENRRVLQLEDVLTADGAGKLAELVRACVDEKFNSLGLFEDYAETIDSSMVYGSMTPYWYFNDRGLVVFYNQYELGPYAAGIIKAVLPYEELEGILLEEYQPAPGTGESGDLVLRENSDEWHMISLTIESEGEKLLIGVEGKVYQVQLSEVFWLEDTPISQELIFSARSLCQNDVLEITGGFDDETRSFAIEFFDGLGQQHIYYLHTGELTQEP